MSALYTVRQVSEVSFEVAVFEDRKEPTSVYRVGVDPNKRFCSCPGFIRAKDGCRHQQMVDDYLEQEINFTGAFYDREEDKIYRPIPLDEPFKIPTEW